jgi:hypothetical protein
MVRKIDQYGFLVARSDRQNKCPTLGGVDPALLRGHMGGEAHPRIGTRRHFLWRALPKRIWSLMTAAPAGKNNMV